jgi:hypothetical protein
MNWMYRLAVTALLLAQFAFAADRWIEYRIGPFRIVSNAGDKAARDRLNEMEQLRHVLGLMLGKDTLAVGGVSAGELKTVWPIDLVLFATVKDYGPHALQQPFIEGGSAMLGAWTADVPLSRDILRALTRMLIDENAGVMPDAIETALCDLFSTIKETGPKVFVGTPLPIGELPPDRMREWAKVQMIATLPEYSGKLRVYLNNLQGGGDVGMATRNAFDMTPAKLDAVVDAYLKAGHFEAASMQGEALNPNRDFIEKQMDKASVDAVLAELAAGGKNFPPDSARGLVAKGTTAAYELAMKANPRWGEPHFKLAQLQSNPTQRIAELKLAAKLDPRNVMYWQTLAEAQTGANQYGDAEKSWTAAMKAALTDSERARIRQVRVDLTEKRADWEESERKRIALEQARELQRIKNAAAAEVHAAEAAINQKVGGLDSNQKPQAWWDEAPGQKAVGKLARVDCLAGNSLRLTINLDGGGTIRLMIRDLNKLGVGTGDAPPSIEPQNVQAIPKAKFVCGAQRVPSKIRVIYNVNADAKLNTVGDIATVELP